MVFGKTHLYGSCFFDSSGVFRWGWVGVMKSHSVCRLVAFPELPLQEKGRRALMVRALSFSKWNTPLQDACESKPWESEVTHLHILMRFINTRRPERFAKRHCCSYSLVWQRSLHCHFAFLLSMSVIKIEVEAGAEERIPSTNCFLGLWRGSAVLWTKMPWARGTSWMTVSQDWETLPIQAGLNPSRRTEHSGNGGGPAGSMFLFSMETSCGSLKIEHILSSWLEEVAQKYSPLGLCLKWHALCQGGCRWWAGARDSGAAYCRLSRRMQHPSQLPKEHKPSKSMLLGPRTSLYPAWRGGLPKDTPPVFQVRLSLPS